MDRYNSLHEADLEEEIQDREISLGASTVLGIFFGLALVCALFFGLGYSMGRRSVQPMAAGATSAPVAMPAVSTSKPPSGSSEGAGDDLAVAVKPTPGTDSIPADAAKPSTLVPDVPVSAAGVPAAQPQTFMVQIAAVSHREDADILVTNLKMRGYDVAIRQEPQDKLMHVQVGPFKVRKDAEAMRERLLSDGYNAIVK